MLRFEREYVSFKPRSAPETIVKSSILFLQVIENQKYWFAARTRDKQEFAVRKSLDKLKSEEKLDLDYYLPTRIVISQLKYRRKRSEVPVIRNLIFICATKQTACDISNVYNVQLFYMKDLFTHSMLVVPDKQMVELQYRIKTGYKLDLADPKRYTEKLQWYKLYYRDPVMAECVDKSTVRKFVSERGLSGILNECYGVYE